MIRVTVLDHGAGNLRSVYRSLAAVGAEVTTSADPQVIAEATHLVVPGQGAFGDCMTRLDRQGLANPIHSHIVSGKPYLGICLGLQILFETGSEGGLHQGLGVLGGTCERIPQRAGAKVPHMGWSQVNGPVGSEVQHAGLVPMLGQWFYFVHSYQVIPKNQALDRVVVHHGGMEIVAAIAKDNVLACQFHPEKSHIAGLSVMRRFLETS